MRNAFKMTFPVAVGMHREQHTGAVFVGMDTSQMCRGNDLAAGIEIDVRGQRKQLAKNTIVEQPLCAQAFENGMCSSPSVNQLSRRPYGRDRGEFSSRKPTVRIWWRGRIQA